MSFAALQQSTVNPIILATLDRTRGSVVTMPKNETPRKRKQALDDALLADVPASSKSFNERAQDPLSSRTA